MPQAASMRLTSASDANGLTLNMTVAIAMAMPRVEARGMRCAHGRSTVEGDHLMTLAVLFDFNGVLVDDEDVHFEAFRRVLGVFDLTIEHHVYRRFLGFDDRN